MTTGWMDSAACASVDTSVFYPAPGQPHRQAYRALCRSCPVRCECFAWGLLREQYGVWGGTDAYERAVMRDELAVGHTTLAELFACRDCDVDVVRVAE